MICETCQGEGKHMAIGCPGAKLIWVECGDCDGQGEISEQQMAWRARGETLRERRRALGWALRLFALHIGQDAGKVIHMERGLEDPTPLEEWLRDLPQKDWR